MNHEAEKFLDDLAAEGVGGIAGVPCSSMGGLIHAASCRTDVGYVNAPNEGEALAYTAGAWLGGRYMATFCQNSGLGNLFNALTSLLAPYQIPGLILCGWRGRPGTHDEPQHLLMGGLSQSLLRSAGVDVSLLDATADPRLLLDRLGSRLAQRELLAALIGPETFPSTDGASYATPAPLSPKAGPPVRGRAGPGLSRRDALAILRARIPASAHVVVSTGLLSREYCALGDDPTAFYLAGAMGHASSLALGVATTSGRPVVVFEGDGSFLMRMSALPFVGTARPGRFAHLVLDNGLHASTGGQPTLSASIDMASVALASGYRAAFETAAPEEAADWMAASLNDIEGPTFIRLRIAAGGSIPPRLPMPLSTIATRFRNSLMDGRRTGTA